MEKEYFGIKVDTSKMTLEELKNAQFEVRELLRDVNYQITMRTLTEHKHHSSEN